MRSFAALSVSALVFVLACGSSGDGSSSGGDDQLLNHDGSSGSFSSSSSGSSNGSSGSTCAATKAEVGKPKVDMIFVIDDSGSMTEEMNQIKTNVNTFASKVATFNLDYTVLFIVKRASSPTATGNVICVPAPLGGASCADNPPTFHHINQDVQSNNSLSLILSTYDSPNANLAWKSYLRQDATKVFIEVTDDESTLSADSFETQLFAKQPAGMFGDAAHRKYIFHSIISKPANVVVTPGNLSSAKCPTAANTSKQYQDLSLRTGGIMDEVCKTDYSGVLDNIAKGIGARLGCELGYPTGAGADPDKVVVTFTASGAAAQPLTQVTDSSKCGSVANAWYYDDNNAPKKIILCPTMCTTVQSSANAKIDALVGCKGAPPS